MYVPVVLYCSRTNSCDVDVFIHTINYIMSVSHLYRNAHGSAQRVPRKSKRHVRYICLSSLLSQTRWQFVYWPDASLKTKKAVLSQGKPRDAAENFHTHRILQRHRKRSFPHSTAFLLLFVCRVQWFVWQKLTSTRKNDRVRSHIYCSLLGSHDADSGVAPRCISGRPRRQPRLLCK